MKRVKTICFRIIEKISPEISENVKGDLEEVYQRTLQTHNKRRAFILFFIEWITCLKLILNENSFFSLRITSISASLKMSWRMVTKNWAYSIVSLAGLTSGLAASMIIFIFVNTELGYDSHHRKSDRIYRVLYDLTEKSEKLPWAIVQGRWAPMIKDRFPEVKSFTRIVPTWGSKSLMKAEGKVNGSYEDGFMWADSTINSVFDFKWIAGDQLNPIAQPNSIIISEEVAIKYFENAEKAIGKTLNRDNETDYTVMAVFEQMPTTSHFHPQMIASLMTGTTTESRGRMWNYSYLVLEEGSDLDNLTSKLTDLVKQNVNATVLPKLDLQPLGSIYLDSRLMYEFEPVGNRSTVSMFIGVGFFILLIACINFINLSTAYSAKRTKEIGLKKVLGVQRNSLIQQLIIESIMITFMGVLLASILSLSLIPSVELLIDKKLDTSYLWNIKYIIYLFCSVLLIGILAGAYPAFYISAHRPADIFIKSKSKGKPFFRKSLSVVQFVLSISLIAGSLIVYQQMEYFQSKDMGIETDKALVLPLDYAQKIKDNQAAFRTDLLQNPHIKNMSFMTSLPGELIRMWVGDIRASHKTDDDKIRVKIFDADYDFIETLGIDLIEGRDYSRAFSMDTSNAVIINETAAKALGIIELDSASIYSYSPSYQKRLKVIGIVEDFHFASLHSEIEPLVIYNRTETNNKSKLVLKVDTQDLANTLEYIETVWNAYVPDRSFDSYFLDEYFQTKYTKEKTIMRLLLCFTFLAVLIACLGLLGLATYVLQNRQKEVSVRKVLGASVGNLWILLTSEFIWLILIAFCVASPLIYMLMDHWLSDFAYRVDISLLVFFLAVAIVLVPALLLISIKSIRIANVNPTDVLSKE